MNKLRYIALALCAVTAFGLICGCNDTKPAGTVSDGVSQIDSDNSSSGTVSEDPIFRKTGKLTDEEIKIIAADRIGKYNDFLDFITNECFDKYTDKTKKLPISSPEYYKIIDDGKYNISTYENFIKCETEFLCTYKEIDKIYTYRTVRSIDIDGKTAYAYTGYNKLLTSFEEKKDAGESTEYVYIRKCEPRTEKYAADECVPVDSGDDFFIVDVPVYTADGKSVIRKDTAVFLCRSKGYGLAFFVDGNFEDFPELSDSEAQKIADSLGTAYTNIYKYFLSTGISSSDKNNTIPYSDGTYRKMGADKKTGLNSSNILSYFSETYVDTDIPSYFEYYHGTLPLEFIIDGKKHYTTNRNIIQFSFAEYNNELYVSDAGSSLDCFPRAENIKILLRERNLMEIAVPIYETTGEPNGNSHLWIVRTNGKYKILYP